MYIVYAHYIVITYNIVVYSNQHFDRQMQLLYVSSNTKVHLNSFRFHKYTLLLIPNLLDCHFEIPDYFGDVVDKEKKINYGVALKV